MGRHAYKAYDYDFHEQVVQYEQQEYSEEDAREKASNDLFYKYRKSVMEAYWNALIIINNVKNTSSLSSMLTDFAYESFHLGTKYSPFIQ